MRIRLVVSVVLLVAAGPARAALVLEYIRVNAITAGPATDPAFTGPLVMDATGQVAPATVFLQIALRDTLGSGPEYGQPGTVAWQTNGGLAGDDSIGLGAFFLRFDSAPGVAVNPAPTSPATARLVYGTEYAPVSAGSSPPTFTRLGGLINFGFEPGAVPDPVTGRIALMNLRITAVGNGTGTFLLRDPNPQTNSVDNAIYRDSCLGCGNQSGYLTTIDDLLFGPSFNTTYNLPVVVIPEPSALALGAATITAAAALRRRRDERRGPRSPG